MKSSPCFQFYPDDFVGGAPGLMEPDDTHVYIWLMCLEWNQNGFIFEEKTLAKWCRISRSRFQHAWEKVQHSFMQREGRWYHPRLDKERQKQQLWREKSSAGGKHSAEKRSRVVEPAFNDPTKGGAALQLSVAVAVPVPKELPTGGVETEPTPPKSVPAKPERPKREPAAWMGSARPLWRRYYGGDPPKGVATQLGRVVREVGEAEMLARLERYLGLTPAAYANVPKFAATHGSYAATAPPANARPALVKPEDEKMKLIRIGSQIDTRKQEYDGDEWWARMQEEANAKGAKNYRDVLLYAADHLGEESAA